MAAKKPAGAKRRQGHDPAEHAAPQERAAGNTPSGAAALDSTKRGSSGVEHGLHTPKVAGSSPALASKTHADWEAIERDYRAGVLSLREIAIPNGITEGAIRKRAKRDGWERDLDAKIQARADALVRKQEVRSAVRSDEAATERQIIEANAERIAQVRGEHRADITRLRTLVLKLIAECEAESGDPDLFADLGELMRNPGEDGTDRLNDAYRKAVSLPTRIKGVKELADTLKVLVGLEREAYGIGSGDGEGKEQPFAEALAGFVGRIHESGAGRIQFQAAVGVKR